MAFENAYAATTTPGTAGLIITANNGVGGYATQSFTLTVGGPPASSPAAITSANNATFTAGTAGSFTITTTGYPTPALTVCGAPTGITFTDNKNGTATLSGRLLLLLGLRSDDPRRAMVWEVMRHRALR